METWAGIHYWLYGIREFFAVMSIGLISQILADISLRGNEMRTIRLQQLQRYWKYAIVTVTVFLLSCSWLPWVKAETIYEKRDSGGNVVSRTVERTASEQNMAEHEYVNPADGSRMYFMDGNTGRMMDKDAFEGLVRQRNEAVTRVNDSILGMAKSDYKSGKITQDELLEHQSRIRVANGNLTQWVSSIHEENKAFVKNPSTTPSDNKTKVVITQKPKVLVS